MTYILNLSWLIRIKYEISKWVVRWLFNYWVWQLIEQLTIYVRLIKQTENNKEHIDLLFIFSEKNI